ncbi:hypothetical protein BD309DRAFT_1023453 [Dichomitus squalens]|nr:hypothetical protein BD309DRAFT_1023453 [Dichomitus squalens]
MSRSCKTELTQAIEEMEALVKRPRAADQESSDESQFRMVKSPPKTPRDVWGHASPSSSSSLAVGGVVKVTGPGDDTRWTANFGAVAVQSVQ